MGAPRGTTKLRYAGFGLPLHDACTTITFDEHPNQDPALAPKQDLYFGIGRWLTYHRINVETLMKRAVSAKAVSAPKDLVRTHHIEPCADASGP